ncbi:MAG: hypothetical protein Tsb0013_20630 [Phycisphaerales bacterium]
MPAPALVICDGGLASTVGARLEAERCPPVAWIPPASAALLPPHGEDHEQVLATVQRQADLNGYASVIDAGSAGSTDRGVGPMSAPIALLEAIRAAMANGCERVVWPVACGNDLDAISAAAERALLITRLAWLEEGSLTGPAPRIDTPLIDLSEPALDELARDLDLEQGSWIASHATARA